MKFGNKEHTILNWIDNEGKGHSEYISAVSFDYSSAEPYLASYEEENMEILNGLLKIDLASIRALREGNAGRLAELETSAIALRKKLKNAP